MKQIKPFLKFGLAAMSPIMVAGQTFAEDDPPKSTKTTTVVVSGADGDIDAVLARVKTQLDKAGVPEENRDKILGQVRESIEKATLAKKELAQAGKAAAEAGKAAADAVSETATIIMRSDDSGDGTGARAERTIRVRGMNLEDLQKKLPQMIQGRVLQGMRESGPSYRIGISLTQRAEEDEDEGDNEGDDEGEGDESEDIVLMVEDVLDESPASEAGVHTGDIVMSVNGQKVKVFTEVQQAVQEAGKNEKPVVLEVIREGKEMTIQVVPTKTEESDVGVMDLNLMPQRDIVVGRGFVFGDGDKHAGEWKFEPSHGAAWTVSGGDESLKKEVQELRSEIAELKEMIKKLMSK